MNRTDQATLANIQERDEKAPCVSPTCHRVAADRRLLLQIIERLRREAGDLEEELREQANQFRDEISELNREHHREMNEAGAELRAMEREVERAERDYEGGWL